MPPQHGPPYAPENAALGGVPTVHTDVPITAVFLILFIIGAVSHMTIFQINQRRGHKFLMSGMMFGFCMARIVTCVMRIVWATRPRNVRIAIAAQVFVAAGVVLLFVVNLIFAQRIVRSCHPNSGWHPIFSLGFKAIYVLIVITLIMLIAAVIQQFYTLNLNTRRIDRDIQHYGQTFYAIISFLPIPLVIFGLVIPRKTRVEKFGSGRFRIKIYILLLATVVLCLGASFRAGTNYLALRPANDPAWYLSKACFYIFNFVVEILVIYLYVAVRVDKRFWVPNGSHAAGDYSRKESTEEKSTVEKGTEEKSTEEKGTEEKGLAEPADKEGRAEGIMSEEEVFDDQRPPDRSPERHRDAEAAIGTAS